MDFITRWEKSGASERANYQLFLSELCDFLGVERPEPAQSIDHLNTYVFDKPVTFHNPDGTTSSGFIDLYRRESFVLEAKQGGEKTVQPAALTLFGDADLPPLSKPKVKKGTATRGTKGWDDAMVRARGQAEQYIRALPATEGNPPFLIVTDVGYSIELFADFSRAGKTYLPFPDARTHRIFLRDLEKEEIRERLKLVWENPLELDPSRKSALVTREVAERLAALARSLEAAGHKPQEVASFLMKCLFTMFAEDVELIPLKGFENLLEKFRNDPDKLRPMLESLWKTMDEGGFSPVLAEDLLRFNGGLFANSTTLPLTVPQIQLLLDAAKADWQHVEPAIFGTLLERALDPIERHKLGAHYTPRAYVERLVLPTVIEPLREEWSATQAAAFTLATAGKRDEAIREVKEFHRRLCEIRVLDPACGSGNFLYVALEQMKRLEGEVLRTLSDFGAATFDEEFTVDPHQFLGIEVNPRAAAIAELVLWIGSLQWHFRTRGDALPREPVLKAFHNIECRDALLEWDSVEPVTDADGKPVTRWDGRTMKKHPVTGEDVPDDSARVPVVKYVNPRKASWPEANFIVGNPPFIGTAKMRQSLGDGYTETVRKVYSEVPESADFVVYWWDIAASLVRAEKVRRFGFIATNSLRQNFNRRTIQKHLDATNPISIIYAIPDHPWEFSPEGAAVRISMTIAEVGEKDGLLDTIQSERDLGDHEIEVLLFSRYGKINSDMTIGSKVVKAKKLRATEKLSGVGVMLGGSGFLVTPDEAKKLGLGRIAGLENHIRPYLHGRDINDKPRNLMVIDLYGLTEETVLNRFPEVYQWVIERVKPERDQNNRASRREKWWIFGEPISTFRPALSGLKRFIVTVETSKHRFFIFLDSSILPDKMLIAIALNDSFALGILSSRIHIVWALATGGRLGVGNDPRYNKSRCFDTFPFPDCTEEQKAIIRDLGERLDAHRKRQQAAHPDLTLTEMYNVLESLRAGRELTAKERAIHEKGLVTILRQLHDELDAAVAAAYGWSADLSDEEILERLVALNAERAAEESRGIIRWLRPEYQKPDATQTGFDATSDAEETPKPSAPKVKPVFPKELAEQAKATRAMLAALGVAKPDDVARAFKGARLERVSDLLATLASLGQARALGDGRFTI